MVVMLRTCCCGWSLGTGTIIIGIVETLGGITNVILSIIAAAEAELDPRAEESVLDALDTIKVTNILLAVVAAVLTILGVLLIAGAKRNSPSLLVPWMIYTCFYIFATVVSYVINTVAYSEAGKPLLAGISVIGAILNLSIQTYFILVVYSLYRELRGEDLLNL
ncbi:uncharacterized protein LOC110829665 [Zootermopsis nevadensis]|uniref:uncharacterized protein LOC110829665 n=1 Tax=Zootermopsis nevadensis TaxID=136037 RepID=UPI000B8E517F|nr:uncharacterized protein LOC110829665 [Zootermopsis nevadensis]